MVKSSPHAFWVLDNTNPQLRIFFEQTNFYRRYITNRGLEEQRISRSAPIRVVADGLKSLIGRDSFEQLGLAVTQYSSSSGNQVNTISPYPEFIENIALTYPKLIFQIERSKNHVEILKFHTNFQTRRQKGRRITINLQIKVNKEFKKLLAEKNIMKLTNCLDYYFISPIKVTVKKSQVN